MPIDKMTSDDLGWVPRTKNEICMLQSQLAAVRNL